MRPRWPPFVAGERAMLESWLDWHRQTLALKCDGLSVEQLRKRAAEPSTMSLLGLVRHMTEVERSWFRRRLDGVPIDWLYAREDDEDADFNEVDSADVDEAFATWRAECEASREVMTRVDSLDRTFVHWDADMSVRWLLVHMIEEYARHNGHADLLREKLDGSTGL